MIDLGGVEVGDNAVVGVSYVVTKITPENTINFYRPE